MVENKYFTALAQYGFQPAGQNFCVGTWRNYAVALQNYSAKAAFLYVAIRVAKEQTKELRNALKTALKASVGKNIAVYAIHPNFAQFSVKLGKAETAAQEFAALVEPVTAALWETGVAPANTCALTQAANPDSLCLLSAPGYIGYQPVCAASVRKEDYALQEKTEENENNGSYGTGLAGALLGALAGIAVNLLTMVFLHFMSAWLFALIPVFAFFGYKKLNGKTDKVALIIVIAISILSLPVMLVLELAFEVVKEYGAPFGEALRFGMESLTNTEVLSAMSKDLIFMVIFMVIGVFVGWGYMHSQLNSTKLQNSKAKLESMRSNPNYQPQQAAPQQPCEVPQPTFQAPQQ